MSEEVKVIKLDLACGQNKQQGFTGVDIAGDCDIKHDLNIYPYPFEDNSVDEILCSHFVEHVKDLPLFMDECYRIMKVGAKMTVIAPYYSSVRAWQDPYHVRPISEQSFMYYNKEWRKVNKLDHYPIKSDFDFTYGYAFHPLWQTKSEEAKLFALNHYNNVASDIQAVLTKKG